MIKTIHKCTTGYQIDVQPNNKSKTINNLDPEDILTDLKNRQLLLNRLINDGNNTIEVEELQQSLAQTILDLEQIIDD